MNKPEKLSQGMIVSYSLINAFNTMASTVPTLFLSMFMTDFLGVSPVALGTGLLVAKLIDFVISIVAGAIVEKVHFKSKKRGRYLSWLRLLTITLVFGNIMQVFDTSNMISTPTVRLIFGMIFYVMFHGSMNFNSIARAGMVPKLAKADMNARNMLTARQGQFVAFWNIFSLMVTLPLVKWIQTVTGSQTLGYTVAAALFSSCFAVTNLLFCKKAEPYDPYEPLVDEDGNVRRTPTVKEIFASVWSNKQMLVLFLAVTLTQLGTQVYSGLLTYFFRVTNTYSTHYTGALTWRSIIGFAASILAPMIGRKLGKKSSIITGYIISAIGGVIIWLCALNPDGSPNIPMMIICMCLKQTADYFYKAYQANYWLDCGEYDYYKTGIDNRTMSVTVMSWPTKIGLMLGSSISAYSLAFCGYHPPVDGALGYFDNMPRFMLTIGLIPAIILILGVIIIAVFYKLSDAKAAEYARLNLEREAKQKGEAKEE